MTSLTEARANFAARLFEMYPSFIPTQSIYLDLEGRKNGSEDILSLYWPVLTGSERFTWMRLSENIPITLNGFLKHIESLRASEAKWIIVFSGGQEEPDERNRLTDLLGKDPFIDRDWINLHHVVQKSQSLKQSIREHRNVWHCKDRSRVRYSLEALEWEFGIERPQHIRSHSNCYRDLAGGNGAMEVLSISQRSKNGTASDDEETSLKQYCEADVKNMFHIANTSERMVFSKTERSSRRSLH